MSDNFKYKTRYEFTVHATSDLENDLNISQASLENLRPLIPKSIDLERNIDLVGAAFNAAVVNKFNRNGDGINSETAVDLIDYFVNKPTNIEHKKQKVVGHIVNAGFADVDNNKILGNAAALSTKDPYYISLAAVIYKTVNKQFADVLLDSSDEESDCFKKISASWELGFNDFVLALGSKDLKDAEIITDPTHINEMKHFLKAFEGAGALNDGTPIYRLVVGDVFPLGIGFTTNPAADVSGLIVQKNIDLEVNDKRDATIPENNFKNNILKISQKEINNVKNTNTMDITEFKTEFEKVLDSKLADNAEFTQEAVATVASHVIDKIREKDAEFQAEREAVEAAKAQAEKDASEAKSSIDDLQTKLEEANEKINSLESSINAAAAEQLFNSRMEAIDELYDLSDQDRTVLANEVKILEASDEAFEGYQSKLASLLLHKSKAFQVEQEKQFEAKVQEELEKRLATTSQEGVAIATEAVPQTNETVEEVVENVEVPHASIANNNEASSTEESLSDQFRRAFNTENISITY
jgi:hypothetical protein